MLSQNIAVPNTYSSTAQGPLTSTSTLPNWSTLLSAGAPRVAAQPTETAGWGKRTSVASPKFDATGRLCLSDGWFLIRGDDSYFLEYADNGLDIPAEAICNVPCNCANSSRSVVAQPTDEACAGAGEVDCK